MAAMKDQELANLASGVPHSSIPPSHRLLCAAHRRGVSSACWPQQLMKMGLYLGWIRGKGRREKGKVGFGRGGCHRRVPLDPPFPL